MKKALSLLLTFLMVSVLLVANVWAADILIIKGDTVTCNPGDQTVTFNVTVDENPGLCGLTVKLTFDGSVMKCTNIVDGNNIDTLVFSKGKINENDATCSWLNMSDENVHGGTGVIATFTFSINEDATVGNHDVKLEITTSDEKWQTVPFEATNGSITVLGKDFDPKPTLTGTGEVTYDGKAHTISVGNLPEGADVAWSLKDADGNYTPLTDAPSLTSAGTYYVKAEVSKNGYNNVELEGSLTINKAEVTISGITAENREYDGTTDVKVDTSKAVLEGKVAGDDLEATFPTVKLSSPDVDKYTLNFSGTTLTGADAKNYTLKEVEKVTVEIEEKVIKIAIDNVNKAIGTDLPTLTATWDPTTTFVGEDHVEVTLYVDGWSKDAEKVGDKYYIKGIPEVQPAKVAKNYDVQITDGIMTIIDDELLSITVEKGEGFKETYFEGEPFEADGLIVTAHYKENGDVMVSALQCSYDPDTMPNVESDNTKQTITVNYGGQTGTIEVTVNVDDIVSISAATTDEWIWVGDVPTVTVTATYESKKTDTLTTDDYNVVVDNDAEAAEAQVTVTCGTITNKDLKITVIEKALDHLEVVETTEGALSKVAGQTFKVSDDGVTIHAVYKDKSGVESKVDVTSEFDAVEITSATAGKVSKPITYTKEVGGYEKEVTCNLTVDFAAKAVSSITVTAPTKTEYTEGTKFDPAGMTVTITYNDGDVVTVTENYADYNIIFNPTKLELGNSTVTVSCGGKIAQVTVTVIPKVLTGISVETYKETYVNGESFSKDDIKVTAKYDNGSTAVVNNYTVDVDTFALGEQTVKEIVIVTVTYSEKGVEKFATYEVDVLPCVAIVVNGSNQRRYASFNDAMNAARKGETVRVVKDTTIDEDIIVTDDVTVEIENGVTLTQKEGTKITVSSGSLTIKNNNEDTEASVDLTINNEKVTVEAGGTANVEPVKEDDFDAYYAFYLQMLQWRNRTFIVSYKQTEGGTISGANAARFSQSVTFTVTPDDGYAIADVTVNGKSVGAVDTYTIRSIKANTTVSATFEKIETETVEVEIVPETTPWANPFTDVGEMDAFYVAVQYVYENGLFKGMSDTEFGPAITMNRAMFVTVLGRLTGVNVDDFTTVTFADCEAGSWYAPYVEWAAKSGIVNGMSATEFAPDAEITVEQALTILYRYMITMGYDLAGEADLTAYADAASVSDWATPAVQWAVANGIYEAADTLAPQTAAARSLVATLLYNLSGMLAK